MRRSSLFLIFVLVLCTAVSICGEKDLPLLKQRVTDETGTLDRNEVLNLEEKLTQFEKETSTQTAILIIESLKGEDIQDYTFRVAEKNQLGKKGRDNGILLVIAMEERRMRIEVGYGLEGALPDALADQIIRREITPHFRSGDYYEGILSGITAIAEATKGEYTGDGNDGKPSKTSPFIIFIIFIIVGLIMRRLLVSGGQYVGSGKYHNRNPWWWGGFGGGGGGFGGGGSFGGFSGGGGSFGGGGASGGW
jgi:uncharacterized protein